MEALGKSPGTRLFGRGVEALSADDGTPNVEDLQIDDGRLGAPVDGEEAKVELMEHTTHAQAVAVVSVRGDRVELDLPVRAPELTLRLTEVAIGEVRVDGVPLRRAATRSGFETGTYFEEEGSVLIAFDPAQRRCVVETGGE